MNDHKTYLDNLLQHIIEGIRSKKGNELVSIDLRETDNSITDFFVICNAESQRQAQAVADSVEREVKNHLHEKPAHREGYENAQWILLDYLDVVVHIFQPEFRTFFNLEELWADAQVERYKNED